jgi:hypothetical protein
MRVPILVLIALAAACSNGRRPSPSAGEEGGGCWPGAAAERWLAVHDALGLAGFGAAGPVSRGRLEAKGSAERPLAVLPGHRYLVYAFGGPGVEDIDVEVLDDRGRVLASDASAGPVAGTVYLTGASGRRTVRVTMAAGTGDYTTAAWSSAGIRSDAYGVEGAAASCLQPIELALGTSVSGTTVGAYGGLIPPCGRGEAPEHVYRVALPARSTLSATLVARFDGVLSLLSACSPEPSTVLQCADSPVVSDPDRTTLSVTLDPGEYFLSVDGDNGAAGGYVLSASARPVRPLAEVCLDRPLLVPGVVVSGTTDGRVDEFQTGADCAGGSLGPDRAYRLVLDAPSRVRVRLEADHDGALSLRGRCEDPGDVRACNDDAEVTGGEGPIASAIVATLPAGEYTVVVDGFRPDVGGAYGLRADVRPVDALGTLPEDRCSVVVEIFAGEVETVVDLFEAGDDVALSCSSGTGLPDAVYRLVVPGRSLVRVAVRGPGADSAALALRAACDGPDLACGLGRVERVLAPGTYVLAVESPSSGDLSPLTVVRTDLDPDLSRRLCENPPILALGGEVSGTLGAGAGITSGVCGGDGPERAFRFDVASDATVRFDVRAGFDSVLYVRRGCLDDPLPGACNDDWGEGTNSRLDLTLAAGTYVVFVDSYSAGTSGAFTLTSRVVPADDPIDAQPAAEPPPPSQEEMLRLRMELEAARRREEESRLRQP